MKNLMIGTALAALLGTVPAVAQEVFRPAGDATDLYASDFIGMRIYAAETPLDADAYAGIQEGWNDIGEINDVVLSRDGAVEAVLVDIGGFLGMGERQVAVDMSAIRFASDSATADNEGDFFLVLNADRALLEGAPVYERGATTAAPTDTGTTDQAAATDGTATAPADGTMADGSVTTPADGTVVAPADDSVTAPADVTAEAPVDGTVVAPADGAGTDMTATAPVDGAIVREGYLAEDLSAMTTEELTGVNVYGPNDESLGEISDFVLAEDNKISQVVLDVGGFLGIGSKTVALDVDDVQILRGADNSDLRAYVSMTKDQVETLPEVAM